MVFIQYYRRCFFAIIISIILIGISQVGNASSSSTDSPRIIVVGAGMAGLSAAQELRLKGFDNVIILEAMNRTGGRIFTSDFGRDQGWVEMGAQWIFGEYDNPLYEYAINRGLVAFDDIAGQTSSSSGNISGVIYMSDTNRQKIDQNLSASVEEFLTEKMNNIPEDVGKHQAVDIYLREELSKFKSKSHPHHRHHQTDDNLISRIFEWFKMAICGRIGCNRLYEVSLEAEMGRKKCRGNQYVKLKQGFSALLNDISKHIPKDSIILEAPIKVIELLPESKRKAMKTTKPVVVLGMDNSRHEADHVIVTTSLGVLKYNAKQMFNPQLSSKKRDVIERMGFGTVDKIFLEFERPFWRNGTKAIHTIWQSDSPLDADPSTTWARDIYSFWVEPFAPNVLGGWIQGSQAIHMETMHETKVNQDSVNVLKAITGINIPRVRSIKRTNWYQNPFTRGTHTYMKMYASNTVETTGILAEPIYQTENGQQYPAVLFAGEATHPEFYSTVHGARESGIREANRIAKLYGRISASHITYSSLSVTITTLVVTFIVAYTGTSLGGL